ncbi:MAG: YgiT-type zinc finger protein [Candidatus Brocadiaceae bacterium]|nr:YgiT-type zinc finger protein [Candidatus Brocadiaceae bacterium]
MSALWGDQKNRQNYFATDLGFGIVVVKDVPATVCSQCGADWIEDAIASSKPLQMLCAIVLSWQTR